MKLTDLERKSAKLEKRLELLRRNLQLALMMRERHEAAIAKRKEKDAEPHPRTIQWRDDRSQEVETLERKIEEVSEQLGGIRSEIEALLQFNPVQDQVDSLPEGFRLLEKRRWNLPNSRFKTFQDVFTPKEARVIPEQASSLLRREYDELPLEACPVDPERIPDWFIEEFGLTDLEGLSDFEKVQKKMVVATPHLRALFASAVPMTAHRQRTSYRALEVRDFDPRHDGKLIVAHQSGHWNHEKDRKVVQVFGSIYDAHRRTLYIDEGYEAEREKVQGIRARVRHANMELIGKKKGDPRLGEIEEQLIHEVEILQHVTNKYKAESRDILEEVAEIKDSMGRHNPGATCARLVRALDLLEKRLPEAFDKGRYMLEDQKLLGARIEESRSVMHHSLLAFRQICEALQDGNEEYVRDRLKRMPALDKLTVRPFSLYAEKLNEQIYAIRDGIQACDGEFVREQSVNAYVICKIFDVQHAREKVLRDIAKNPMETTIENLLGQSLKIRKVVHSREVLPEITTSYQNIYLAIATSIDDLVRGLEFYSRQDLSDTERLLMYERLKTFMENIDFAEILEKLR